MLSSPAWAQALVGRGFVLCRAGDTRKGCVVALRAVKQQQQGFGERCQACGQCGHRVFWREFSRDPWEGSSLTLNLFARCEDNVQLCESCMLPVVNC